MKGQIDDESFGPDKPPSIFDKMRQRTLTTRLTEDLNNREPF